MHCRQYGAQLRDAHSRITAAGADVVAIGTGNMMYANDFVVSMKIPFPVLIDEQGEAAKAASLRSMKPWDLFKPSLWKSSKATRKAGFKQTKAGKRPMQLGATYVIDTSGTVRFEHLESEPSDHASINAVVAALR